MSSETTVAKIAARVKAGTHAGVLNVQMILFERALKAAEDQGKDMGMIAYGIASGVTGADKWSRCLACVWLDNNGYDWWPVNNFSMES